MIHLIHTGMSQAYFKLKHRKEIVSIIKGITGLKYYQYLSHKLGSNVLFCLPEKNPWNEYMALLSFAWIDFLSAKF